MTAEAMPEEARAPARPPRRLPLHALSEHTRVRLETALVLDAIATTLVVAWSTRASWRQGPGGPHPYLVGAIALGVASVLVARGLGRRWWTVTPLRHVMAAGFVGLAVLSTVASGGAFALVPHVLVIAFLLSSFRDPAVIATVGGMLAGCAVAYELLVRAGGPPLVRFEDAGWLVVCLVGLGLHTRRVRGLVDEFVRERCDRELGQLQADEARERERREWLDTTEQGRREQELSARAELLAGLSHELRTPLHAVVGFLELLTRSELSPSQSRHVEGAHASAEHVLALVADVLDSAKLESGRLELVREPFDVRAVLGDARRLLEGQARDRGVHVELALAEDLDVPLVGDALRVRQIVINLLGNAVKFARSRVTLRARWVGETDALEIDVEDDGRGIAPTALSRIFQPYRQASAGVATRHGGTGLGLAISRRLARLMKGDVVVRSSSEQGSVFRFFAPLPRAEAALAQVVASDPALPRTRPLRILLADDDTASRLVTAELLRHLGHTVVLAHDGQEALDTALDAELDLLVLDVEMPRLDGTEVARQLRLASHPIPVLGLTGHVAHERRLGCLRAGMDAVIEKPAQLSKLAAGIEAALRARTRDESDAARASPPARVRVASEVVMRELGAGLDLDDLLQRTGGDETLARDVLVAVRDETRRLFTDLERAAREGDLEVMRRVAHTLKGCVANVGARPVREAVTAVENAAKAGDRAHAVELAAHALAIGESLSAALAHACDARAA